MNSGEEAKEMGKFAVSDIDWRKINKEASTLRNIERFDEDGNPLFAVSHDHTDCACGPNEGVTLASTLGVENCHLRIERNAAIKRAEKAEAEVISLGQQVTMFREALDHGWTRAEMEFRERERLAALAKDF